MGEEKRKSEVRRVICPYEDADVHKAEAGTPSLAIAKGAWHGKEERKCKTDGHTKTANYEVP